MSDLAKKYPIPVGFVGALALQGMFAGLNALIMLLPLPETVILWIFEAMRLVVTLPEIVLFGWIMRENGFRLAFGSKGFCKGLLASAAPLLYTAFNLLWFTQMASLDRNAFSLLPLVIVQQILVGPMEETAYRGLLMGGMLRRFGKSGFGRLGTALCSALVFGVAHLIGGAAPLHSLNTAVIGFSFAAVYVYSQNLLVCIALHTAWDIAAHMVNRLPSEWEFTAFGSFLSPALQVILYGVMPLTAVLLCFAAKPWREETPNVAIT
jgi:membrane protease YdiL (CAAX protease family)